MRASPAAELSDTAMTTGSDSGGMFENNYSLAFCIFPILSSNDSEGTEIESDWVQGGASESVSVTRSSMSLPSVVFELLVILEEAQLFGGST